MLVSTAIQKAYLHAQRKSTPPAAGTPKYEVLLDLADSVQKLWAEEPSVEWNSLYERVNLTATVTATDTFSLATASITIDHISKVPDDYVLLTNGTNEVKYRLVSPSQLYSYKDQQVCAQVGSNLKFPAAFTSSSTTFGYNIQIPAIKTVSDITAATETIEVDRPMWLVYMMAAEFVRGDVVRQNQYENLLALADQVMEKMRDNNMGSVSEVTVDWQPEGEAWV